MGHTRHQSFVRANDLQANSSDHNVIIHSDGFNYSRFCPGRLFFGRLDFALLTFFRLSDKRFWFFNSDRIVWFFGSSDVSWFFSDLDRVSQGFGSRLVFSDLDRFFRIFSGSSGSWVWGSSDFGSCSVFSGSGFVSFADTKM